MPSSVTLFPVVLHSTYISSATRLFYLQTHVQIQPPPRTSSAAIGACQLDRRLLPTWARPRMTSRLSMQDPMATMLRMRTMYLATVATSWIAPQFARRMSATHTLHTRSSMTVSLLILVDVLQLAKPRLITTRSTKIAKPSVDSSTPTFSQRTAFLKDSTALFILLLGTTHTPEIQGIRLDLTTSPFPTVTATRTPQILDLTIARVVLVALAILATLQPPPRRQQHLRPRPSLRQPPRPVQ